MATNKTKEQDILSSLWDDDDEDSANDPSAMTLVDHLEELRWRIFKSIIAIAVASIIAFVFREQIIQILTYPLPAAQADVLGKDHKLIVTGLMEGFTVYLMISVAVGFIISLPVILYQLWAFIAPALYEKEKKYAVPFILLGIILFVMGVSLGYVVLRYPIQWLVTFAANSFNELITAGSYFTFVAFFMLAFGIVFEIPLVLTFLAQVELITAKTLTKKRAATHVGMWIASTFLTPGADIYSPIFLGVAMSFLFELSIIFIKFTTRKKVAVE
ncbi:MAG TPA: twin-arginine translocase subunit TatC [Ktedonobacteraceae bacterium]|nr:twin-arginine translocase subunit TatC [Ktedonobacteraceae bacterium]